MKKTMNTFLLAGTLACAYAYAHGSTSSELGYVDGGSLIAHWDAIDNQATGTHSASATTWVDLVAAKAFALKRHTWGEEYVSFPGTNSGSDYSGGVLSGSDLLSWTSEDPNRTVEITLKFDGATANGVVFFGTSGTDIAMGRNNSVSTNYWVISSSSKNMTACSIGGGFGCSSMGYVRNTTGLVDDNHIFNNGTAVSRSTSANGWSGTADSNIYLSRRPSGSTSFAGKIYSVRIYKRLLTQEEAAQNFAADQRRFLLKEVATVTAGSVTVDSTVYGVGEKLPVSRATGALVIDSASAAKIEFDPMIASVSLATGSLEIASAKSLTLTDLTLGPDTVLQLPASRQLTVTGTLTAGSGAAVNGPGVLIAADATCPVTLTGGAVYVCFTAGWTGWPSSGVAYIPVGTVVAITDSDVAKVSALDRIVFLDDGNVSTSKITCSLAAGFVLSVPVEGPGTVAFKDAGKVIVRSDNSGLTGQFYFTNTTCVVSNEFGLGGLDAGTCHFWNGDGKKLAFGLAERLVFTNNVPIYMHPLCVNHCPANSGWQNLSFGSQSLGETLVQNALFTTGRYCNHQDYQYPNYTNNVKFLKGLTSVQPAWTQYPYIGGTAGGEVWFYGPLSCTGTGIVFPRAGPTWHFGFSSVTGSFQWSPYTGAKIVCEAGNTFGDRALLLNGQTTINLNGYDQTISGEFANYSAANVTETSVCQLFVTSSVPAVFTISSTKTHVINPVFLGAVSFRHAGSGTNDLVTYESDTTGELRVENGSLTLRNDYSWKGTNVTVTGGTLVLASVRALPTGQANLVVTGGKLTVKSGATVMLASATFGTGAGAVTLADGTYSLSALKVMSGVGTYIGEASDDDASIMVRTPLGGEWTGWPEEGGEVAVPDGNDITVTAGDLVKFMKVTALEIGLNSTVRLSGFGEHITLPMTLSGMGKVVFTDCGRVVITNDNSQLVAPGAFEFTRTDVVVSNRYGLGCSETGPCYIYTTVDQHKMLRFGGDAITNEVAIHVDNNINFGYLDNTVDFCQQGNFTQVGGNTIGGRTTFFHSIVFGGVTTLAYVDLPPTVRFAEGSELRGTGNLVYLFEVGCKAYFDAQNPNLDWVTFQVGLDAELNCDYVFSMSHALGTYANVSTFNLNGHRQLVGGLDFSSGGNWLTDTSPIEFKSADPATLYITNTTAGTSGYARSAKFTGAVSLDYAGTKIQKLGCGLNDTTGSLTVHGGTLMMDNASYWGGTDVKLLGGTLSIGTGCATNTVTGAGLFFNRKTNLIIDSTLAGNRLDIAAGRTETVNSLLLINGATTNYAAKGSYTYGSGTLTVRNDCLNPGSVLFLK